MTAIFVTRHKGAADWALVRGLTAVLKPHLEKGDIDRLGAGDVVLGTLPVNVVADVNAKGARYLHLVLEIPEAERGKELSADDMERLGARLEEYQVERVGS